VVTHYPAASGVLNTIIDGRTIQLRSRRALLRAMESQFAVIDDQSRRAVLWGGVGPVSQSMLRICGRPND
jgi:hypothetical protein